MSSKSLVLTSPQVSLQKPRARQRLGFLRFGALSVSYGKNFASFGLGPALALGAPTPSSKVKVLGKKVHFYRVPDTAIEMQSRGAG